jgi:trans-aconitate methyltransferase
VFNEAMAADSRYLADLVVRECSDVFKGITSLVDVAGGTGTMARAITKAFPHVKCSVLDLPHVIEGSSAQDNVEFIAGDMMEFIPSADRILLKVVFSVHHYKGAQIYNQHAFNKLLSKISEVLCCWIVSMCCIIGATRIV